MDWMRSLEDDETHELSCDGDIHTSSCNTLRFDMVIHCVKFIHGLGCLCGDNVYLVLIIERGFQYIWTVCMNFGQLQPPMRRTLDRKTIHIWWLTNMKYIH